MAIKLLPREVAKEAMGRSPFAEDIKQLKQLTHPGIARIYGGAIEKGQPYLVLELVEGESLEDRLQRRGKLPWEMAVEIVDGIAEALIQAHKQGFVHQRLTPSRVLLPEGGGVKLVGFDCKWADRDEVVGLRSPMRVAHYLSPEQFRGRQSAGFAQCDLFSLGVILYQCLTGRHPWPVDSPAELVQARRDGPAPRVTSQELDSPIWLDDITSKLLSKVRSQRLQTAEEARRMLILAKGKAVSGMSTAQNTLAHQKSSGRDSQQVIELKKIKRKRSSRRSEVAFYEHAWFLGLCLAAIVALGAWVLWPAGEAQLFEKAKPLMESDNPVDWKRAETQYLTPLLERFPETEYQAEIQEFQDRYEMYQAENRIKNLTRLGRQPKTDAERSYAEARNFERFGDRLTAWKRYQALINLFGQSASEYDRPYIKLARRKIELIKADQQDSEDQIAFLESHLRKASSLVEAGRLLDARRILDSVISLYADNQELSPQVEQAREQLRQLDAI